MVLLLPVPLLLLFGLAITLRLTQESRAQPAQSNALIVQSFATAIPATALPAACTVPMSRTRSSSAAGGTREPTAGRSACIFRS